MHFSPKEGQSFDQKGYENLHIMIRSVGIQMRLSTPSSLVQESWEQKIQHKSDHFLSKSEIAVYCEGNEALTQAA